MYSGLTDAQVERLSILSEECGEVIQAVSKIVRHGLESTNPNHRYQPDMTNRVHLAREIGQLLNIVDKLVQLGDIDTEEITKGQFHKKLDIKQYIHYEENV